MFPELSISFETNLKDIFDFLTSLKNRKKSELVTREAALRN